MSVPFTTWLDTLISEKGIDPEQEITVEGKSGPNHMPLQIVIDAIKGTSTREQAGIKQMLVRIDFQNGDVVDYFRHLAQAIAI